MTKEEALKLALEALETSTDWDVSATGRQLKSMQAITALRTALAQTQEPVAWEQFHEHMAGPNYVAPQRTWVGLTAKEKHEFRYSHMTTADFIDAIEAKLKEKNTRGQE